MSDFDALEMIDSVDMLRFALAAIRTELEKDNPNIYDCQTITNESLKLTEAYAKIGKNLTNNETGLTSWREYLKKIKL